MYEKFSQLQSHYHDHHQARISMVDAYKFRIPEKGVEKLENDDQTCAEEKPSEKEQLVDNTPQFSDSGNFAYTCTGRKCGICRRYFINDEELEYHVKNHDKMQYVCQHGNCRFMYEEQSQLQLHFDVRHNKNTVAQSKSGAGNEKACKICNRRFQNMQTLKYHIDHHDDMRYICHEVGCGMMFEVFVQLQKHYAGSHRKGIRVNEGHMYLIDSKSNAEIQTRAAGKRSNKLCAKDTPAKCREDVQFMWSNL